MHQLADHELMRLYADGSAPAFEELFRRYEARAYTYFLRRVRCESRARDLFQELFLRLHRFRATYDPARPFEPWFFHVARHVLVDEWRQSYRRAEVGLEEADLRAGDADAERRTAAREEAARLLDSLSDEQSWVLVGSKLYGFEHTEIAGRLGKSLDAVKQIASRALRRLRAAPVD